MGSRVLALESLALTLRSRALALELASAPEAQYMGTSAPRYDGTSERRDVARDGGRLSDGTSRDIYTREDPCIKCTRSKLDTGQGVLGLVAPEDLFVSLLSRLASGLVFCCLVSTCIFLPWLLCSCVLLCRMLGLPWAFFGPLPGFSWDPFWASEGSFWGSWRPLAS